jgi:predicted dehydrogenase
MRMLRPSIAIVGAGLMGHWHADAARRAGARVSAVVDADAARGVALARRYRATPYATTDALFDSPARLDAAHVCTPPESHGALVRSLLDNGIHVVCEKPLAPTATEVAALYDRAREGGRELCPVHQFTCQQGVVAAREHLDEIGELRRVAFSFHSAGGRGHAGAQLDAIVQDILPHPLSILATLQPRYPLEPVEWRCGSPGPGELLAVGQHGPATVSISISLTARPTEASATLSGTAGSIKLDFFHGYSTLNRGQVSRADKVLRPFANAFTLLGAASGNALRRVLTWEAAYPGLRALLRKFYASFDGSAAAPPFGAAEVIGIYLARDRIAAAMSRKGGA